VLMPPIDVGAGLRTAPKMLRVAKVAIYTSTYAMAECPQVWILGALKPLYTRRGKLPYNTLLEAAVHHLESATRKREVKDLMRNQFPLYAYI
jgi:hypothetical protein